MRLLIAITLGQLAILGCAETTGPDQNRAVQPRKPVALSFDVRPMDGLAGLPLVRVAVAAHDSLGRIATSFSGLVKVTLSTNHAGNTL